MVLRTDNYVTERMPGPAAAGREHGLALAPEAVYRQDGYAVVGDDGTLRQERVPLDTYRRDYYEKRGRADTSTLPGEAGVEQGSDRAFYRLTEEHGYYVEFDEAASVPTDHVGLVVPRENVLRAGVMTHAAPIGPEEDTAEALLHVKANNVLLDHEATVAELVVAEAAAPGEA